MRGEVSEKALIRVMKERTKTWKDWDAEHICDQIEKLCEGFGLEIDWNDYAGVRTFGDICDVICVSIGWRYRAGGRLQMAFQQLRKAIGEIEGLDPSDICANTRLEQLFPRKDRRMKVKTLERTLGCRLHLLKPKPWVILMLVVVMAVSFFSVLVWLQLGVVGLLGGFLGYWLAVWFGKEFRYETIDELAMALMRNGYVYAMHGRGRVNPGEIVRIIEETFRSELRLREEELKRDVEIF